MGELGLELEEFQRRQRICSPELQEMTPRRMAAVKNVWPGIAKIQCGQLDAQPEGLVITEVRCPKAAALRARFF
jgi:hypothetical protein